MAHALNTTPGEQILNRGEVRARLREATHPLHVRLSRLPLLNGLTRPDYPWHFYRMLIAAYFHIYRALEAAIDEAPGRPLLAPYFCYDDRRKLPWLMADLAALGVDPQAPEYCPISPVRVATPVYVGQLIGLLYAIEGSTLGAPIIANALVMTLSVTASSGARFFECYGDDAAIERRWRQFEQCAESLVDTSTQLHNAEVAAVAIFDLMETQLTDYQRRLVK